MKCETFGLDLAGVAFAALPFSTFPAVTFFLAATVLFFGVLGVFILLFDPLTAGVAVEVDGESKIGIIGATLN